MKEYSGETELCMRRFYDSLNEKDQRHYAAVETMRLGHSGKKYIASVLGVNVKTITSGLSELKKTNFLGGASGEKAEGGRKQT